MEITPKLILIILVVGNAAFVLTAIFYRAWKGKRELSIPEFDLKFSEKWVAGFSHQDEQTKLGGASNCLAVELSRKTLVIRPMFPFNLSFLPKMYFLEHLIPTNKIRSVQPCENNDEGRVIIEFESAAGINSIELSLKKRQEFLRAVGTLSGRQPVPSGILT
jgi:hypothetical protein